MCIDYWNLNEATQKDHFPFPFINRMLEKLAGKASKVEVIAKLQPPNCVKVVRSFLRHVGLYRTTQHAFYLTVFTSQPLDILVCV